MCRTLTVGGGKDTVSATVQVARRDAPLGADRFYNLAKHHFFDSRGASDNDAGFFRVVPGAQLLCGPPAFATAHTVREGFVVQFGIPGNTTVGAAWENAVIDNDPVILSNVRGTIAYAAMQDGSGQAVDRTTQIFINFGDNSRLDGMGFTPFGKLDDASMAAIDAISSMYGEQPDQDGIYREGDAYLRKSFPFLDYITDTHVTTPEEPVEPVAVRAEII